MKIFINFPIYIFCSIHHIDNSIKMLRMNINKDESSIYRGGIENKLMIEIYIGIKTTKYGSEMYIERRVYLRGRGQRHVAPPPCCLKV